MLNGENQQGLLVGSVVVVRAGRTARWNMLREIYILDVSVRTEISKPELNEIPD